MIAAFLVLLWLVPIDAVTVPVKLPIDSQIDRFALGALMLAWIVVAATAGKYGPRYRRSPINVAVVAFLAVATASVILNVGALGRSEELSLAIRQLVLIFSYAALYLVVVTVMRREEVPRFISLLIGLACLTAIGLIVQYQTGTNYFFQLTHSLIPGLEVAPEPASTALGRPTIAGPTQHGLAAATLLAMATPFAVVGLMKARNGSVKQLLYMLALGIMLAGALATLRKTSLIVPAAALVPIVFYRPRQALKLLPVSVALLLFVTIVSPSALGNVWGQLTGQGKYATESKISTLGRTSDYESVRPDILSNPLLGRGYGTYDPNDYKSKQIPTRHRFIDNEYLDILLEVGAIGLLAYFSLGVVGLAVLHRRVRSGRPEQAWLALAISAAIFAFMVANVIFDLLAYVQVPYLFFFLLGLAGVLAAPPDRDARRAAS